MLFNTSEKSIENFLYTTILKIVHFYQSIGIESNQISVQLLHYSRDVSIMIQAGNS